LICHAQFYHEENLRSLKDCLKQALLKRGRPKRLYMDNGKIFRSRMILLMGARLGIHIIHSRPYRPQGRAKLERWFGTVRKSFLRRVDVNRIEGIDALNRLLWNWIEGEYHVSPHRGIDRQTPLDRWMERSGGIRPLPSDIPLEELFLEEASRRVTRDGTLSLKGKCFEAGVAFIGMKVTVRFDPFDLRRVFVIAPDGNPVEAFPVDRQANRYVRRDPSTEPPSAKSPPVPLRSLEHLAKERESNPGEPS
jgi:hypothetical protein